MTYKIRINGRHFDFKNLKTLMAKATPARSGDRLAGIAAQNNLERVAAQLVLADVPLDQFLKEALIPYDEDEVTRLIFDDFDNQAFAPIAHLSVGGFRNWLLSDAAGSDALAALRIGITPEMAAAVAKLMRIQDLILVAAKCRVVTRFNNTIGLARRMSTRLQPNHPTDAPSGVAASIVDGLLYGSGDAVIGVNPASDNVAAAVKLITMLDGVIQKFAIPTQACVLAHITTTIKAIEQWCAG